MYFLSNCAFLGETSFRNITKSCKPSIYIICHTATTVIFSVQFSANGMGYQSYSNQVLFHWKLSRKIKFHNRSAPGSVTADLLSVMVFNEGQNKNNMLQSQTFLSGWDSIYQKMTLVNANRLVFYNWATSERSHHRQFKSTSYLAVFLPEVTDYILAVMPLIRNKEF